MSATRFGIPSLVRHDQVRRRGRIVRPHETHHPLERERNGGLLEIRQTTQAVGQAVLQQYGGGAREALAGLRDVDINLPPILNAPLARDEPFGLEPMPYRDGPGGMERGDDPGILGDDDGMA